MANDHAHELWYADGLRFECTLCGHCCTGPPGYVLFNDREARRIAERLGISTTDFLDRYTRDTPEGRSLKEHHTEHGWDCIFLDRESTPGKAVCSLYEDRPTQCRTFPFWPEHIKSPRAWHRLSRECEGIGRGPIVPLTQITISRDEHIRAAREL